MMGPPSGLIGKFSPELVQPTVPQKRALGNAGAHAMISCNLRPEGGGAVSRDPNHRTQYAILSVIAGPRGHPNPPKTTQTVLVEPKIKAEEKTNNNRSPAPQAMPFRCPRTGCDGAETGLRYPKRHTGQRGICFDGQVNKQNSPGRRYLCGRRAQRESKQRKMIRKTKEIVSSSQLIHAVLVSALRDHRGR